MATERKPARRKVGRHWFKLHRKILDSAVIRDGPMLQVWIWLLASANWRRKKLADGSVIQPGQVVCGVHQICEDTRLSRQSVRTALRKLQRTSQVCTKSNRAGTVVTICNWGRYQDQGVRNEHPPNQQLTNDQPTTNQQLTTTKEGKKERISTYKCTKHTCSNTAFARFWALWARKANKARAEKAWPTAVKQVAKERHCSQDEAADWLVARWREFSGTPKALGPFCPYPASWLNAGRWNDDLAIWQEGGEGGPTAAARARQYEQSVAQQIRAREERQRERERNRQEESEATHVAIQKALRGGDLRTERSTAQGTGNRAAD